MTILVTGGTAFIGTSFVLDWIQAEGSPVINLGLLTYAGNLPKSERGEFRFLHVSTTAVRSAAFWRPRETYNIGGWSEKVNLDVVKTLFALLDELHPQSPRTPHADLIAFVDDRPGHDRRYAIDAARSRRIWDGARPGLLKAECVIPRSGDYREGVRPGIDVTKTSPDGQAVRSGRPWHS